jgi:outer membrane murein-binding lipoprotein Lpp
VRIATAVFVEKHMSQEPESEEARLARQAFVFAVERLMAEMYPEWEKRLPMQQWQEELARKRADDDSRASPNAPATAVANTRHDNVSSDAAIQGLSAKLQDVSANLQRMERRFDALTHEIRGAQGSSNQSYNARMLGRFLKRLSAIVSECNPPARVALVVDQNVTVWCGPSRNHLMFSTISAAVASRDVVVCSRRA